MYILIAIFSSLLTSFLWLSFFEVKFYFLRKERKKALMLIFPEATKKELKGNVYDCFDVLSKKYPPKQL